MSVHAVLTGAADLIELKGWVQEGYQSPDGCLCTVGAIVLAAGSGFKYDEDGEPEDFIGNDEPGRTQGEVLSVLRAAAKLVAA